MSPQISPASPPVQDVAEQDAAVASLVEFSSKDFRRPWHHRALGIHPLPADRLEIETAVTRRGVAELLRNQPGSFTSFHDIPWPASGTQPQGRIDSLLVGPTGVYVLGVLEVPGAMVMVMKDEVLVSGKQTDALTVLEAQAEWVNQRLGLTNGDLRARPVLVVNGYRALSVRQGPRHAVVVSVRGLREWLSRRAEAMAPLRVAELSSRARRPDTWELPADWTPSEAEAAAVDSFDALVDTVRRARRTNWVLRFSGGLVMVDALLAAWTWWA